MSQGYNGGFCGQTSVRFAKLLKIFWKGEILRGSELLVYNEGTFSAANLPLNYQIS